MVVRSDVSEVFISCTVLAFIKQLYPSWRSLTNCWFGLNLQTSACDLTGESGLQPNVSERVVVDNI